MMADNDDADDDEDDDGDDHGHTCVTYYSEIFDFHIKRKVFSFN